LQHEGIELFVEFVKLAGRFVEVGVVEFGDAPSIWANRPPLK
jgi:hypothetical protein